MHRNNYTYRLKKNEGNTPLLIGGKMTFKDKEKGIIEYIEKHGGKYVYEGQINAFYISFPHLDDYIMFSSKNPWNDSKKIKVTCYQQKLVKEDFEFIINFIEYLESLGFKEGE